MATYSKTQKGEWVVCGSPAEIKAGASVTVSKRDGSTKVEQIVSVGNPFERNGQRVVYGYIAQRQPTPAPASRPTPRSSNRRYECPECGDYVYSGSRCWETGCTH